jgi:hypothetical protein
MLTRTACAAPRVSLGVIVDNEDMATGMEKKEIEGTADIFWSREPIMGPRGTKENPAIVPSFNTSRVVGLETEQARAASIACGSRLGMRQHDVAPARVPCCRRRRCGDLLRAHRSLARQGVIWFKLEKGPLHLVADQYFKLEQLDGGDHH